MTNNILIKTEHSYTIIKTEDGWIVRSKEYVLDSVDDEVIVQGSSVLSGSASHALSEAVLNAELDCKLKVEKEKRMRGIE